ncbi:hypothetical protein Mp_4g00260 [Marchantia polymorpha subsp. ruderalis]|uniref:Uncharacterized protein n=2 Tax=Marchantia polymorpha TaxID=3197 RepID=A0AAF6B4T3_MARPO|nr:hypothetical protein MARPO_0066s0115 [Marchantia polymorpha]BBN07017.1 hypothetical protein Mp_4g00260 [Marchantia polymorpha subsp. ruderalis]|eukprot:PTQ36167.1 hypothetical protein MARPO_0066s0115 [Marchantia polymorpha]
METRGATSVVGGVALECQRNRVRSTWRGGKAMSAAENFRQGATWPKAVGREGGHRLQVATSKEHAVQVSALRGRKCRSGKVWRTEGRGAQWPLGAISRTGAESEQGTGGRGSKVGYDASQRLEQMRDPEAGVSNGQARQQWQEQSREWSSEGGTGRSGGNVDLHRDMRIRGSVAIAHDRLG